MVEIALYLVPGFAASRAWIEAIEPPPLRALVIALLSLPPYLIYSLGTGTFHWRSFALLAGIATVASAWYVLSSKHFYSDVLFLGFFAAVVLLRVFPRIFIELAPHATAGVLGQLMWIRTGILAVLTLRSLAGTGFGFIPARKDWSIGIQHFLLFIPVAAVSAMAIHFARPHAAHGAWWKVAAQFALTFAGILWVVALWEEFFCRGMLQQILARRLNSTVAGLLVTSVLFGLSHLPFRAFPNWRFATMAALAGLFYGWAFLRAGSVRASMVTHALVVATWKVFFF